MDKTYKFTLPSPNFNKNIQDMCKSKHPYLTPSGMSLLPREKQPPPMYGKRGATFPARFLKNAGQPHEKISTTQMEKQYCEPCEIELNSLEDLKRHRAQHEVCPVDGCLYKGHPSVMDKHVNALHASGLFDKFKKLSTPEEIAAWREERRKRYPTLANVLLKQKAKEQRQKRGERIESNKKRFGDSNDRKRAQPNLQETERVMEDKKPRIENKRLTKNKRKNKKNCRNAESKPKGHPEKHENAKLENVSELSCEGINMFKGTNQLKNYEHFSDNKEPIKNALFSLVGMYGSDDEDSISTDCVDEVEHETDKNIEPNLKSSLQENFENKSSPNTNFESLNNGSDLNNSSIKSNEHNPTSVEFEVAPMEVKSDDETPEELPIRNVNPENFDNKSSPNTNIESLNNGLDFNNSSIQSNEHNPTSVECEIAAMEVKSDDEAPEEIPIRRDNPDPSFEVKREPNPPLPNPTANKYNTEKPKKKEISKQQKKFGLDYRKARLRKQNTLLEKLLESDIRHERNVLLQCVRFVCENNFFNVGQNKTECPNGSR